MNTERKYRRRNGVARRKIAGEAFLIPVCGTPVDMENIFVLNPVGDFIWQRLDGQQSLAQIAEQISGEFDITAGQSLADTREFVSQLETNQLVELLEENR